MLQLDLPYDQQAQTQENIAPFVFASNNVAVTRNLETFRIRARPSRSYVEGDYYLYVESVGSVVHHWLLISRQLYSRELNQVTLAIANYLRSEDNPKGVTMDEFSDTQSAVRWLNIMAMEHGFGCETSHRGDEITLDGKACAVIHYVNVTIEDFETARNGLRLHPCRFEKVRLSR